MKTQKHTGYDAPFFDKEEEEQIKALERGEYVSIRPLAESIEFWQEVARNYRKRNITKP